MNAGKWDNVCVKFIIIFQTLNNMSQNKQIFTISLAFVKMMFLAVGLALENNSFFIPALQDSQNTPTGRRGYKIKIK